MFSLDHRDVSFEALRSAVSRLGLLAGVAVAAAASAPTLNTCSPEDLLSSPARHGSSARESGRVIILPGVRNTQFQLAGFVREIEALLPNFDVEVRRWGTPLLGLRNLRAHERNNATANAIAAEIAEWRRSNPQAKLYLVGYSGGGGMAVLIASALPDDVALDRLVLVAPAISPSYPIVDAVLPHVSEFLVNYSSSKDLQVGAGTLRFGTIDREFTQAAGASGFAMKHPRIVQWQWTDIDRRLGHAGNHVAYLGRRWQRANLVPVLDPRNGSDTILAHWQAVRYALAE